MRGWNAPAVVVAGRGGTLRQPFPLPGGLTPYRWVAQLEVLAGQPLRWWIDVPPQRATMGGTETQEERLHP